MIQYDNALSLCMVCPIGMMMIIPRMSMQQGGGSLSFFPALFDILLLLTAILSTLVSLLIPCVYYLKRQCRQHPTVLIANIALLQSIANFNIVLMAVDIFAYEGSVRIDSIFSWLTFGLVQIEPALEETDFCIYNYCVYMVVELLSISFHICYAVDLLLTVKLPFLTGRKRRKFYYGFSVVLLIVTMANSVAEAEEICTNELKIQSIYKVPLWFLVALVLFCLVAIVIIGMSFCQGRGQAKIRREYIRHHRIILMLLLLTWIPPIMTNFLIRLDQMETPLFDIANKLAFFFMVALTGVMTIVRIAYDRFLREKVRQMLSFGKRRGQPLQQRPISAVPEQDYLQLTQKPHKINEQVWNLPLSGAMNEFQSQEVVHCIIQVVTEACAARLPQKQSTNQGRGSVRESVRNSTMLYESVYRNTIVIQGEEEGGQSGGLFSLFTKKGNSLDRYELLSPHDASLAELKRLCKKKRKFNMVCRPPERESSTDRLQQKTVHIKSNLMATESFSAEQAAKLLNIKVTSYSHRVFQALRQYDGLTTESITQALGLQKNVQSIRRAKQSLGASGSFFFFSSDKKLVIKTISQQQMEQLLTLLPFYFDHIRYNPSSLFARTYGIFAIEIAGISKIYFQMMENAFQELQRAGMQYRIYDLKGSTVQREVKDPHASVKKDINYFRSADCFMFVSPELKIRLIDQVTKDIEMLRKQNVMDFSLLLGVARSKKEKGMHEQYYHNPGRRLTHRRTNAASDLNWRYLNQLQPFTGRIYALSLIDYLQEFNFSKKMQLWLKRIFKGGGDISSVDTKAYHRRFLTFLQRVAIVFNVKIQHGKPIFRMADAL